MVKVRRGTLLGGLWKIARGILVTCKHIRDNTGCLKNAFKAQIWCQKINKKVWNCYAVIFYLMGVNFITFRPKTSPSPRKWYWNHPSTPCLSALQVHGQLLSFWHQKSLKSVFLDTLYVVFHSSLKENNMPNISFFSIYKPVPLHRLIIYIMIPELVYHIPMCISRGSGRAGGPKIVCISSCIKVVLIK